MSFGLRCILEEYSILIVIWLKITTKKTDLISPEHDTFQYFHPRLSRNIQGLLLNEKESLMAKQTVLVMIQIYWFRPENNVLLILIDNNFAHNDC